MRIFSRYTDKYHGKGFYRYGSQRCSDLEVAQVDHSIHHLADAETVAKVMEWVVAVVFLDCQL